MMRAMLRVRERDSMNAIMFIALLWVRDQILEIGSQL